jgi:hypothetical protein
VLTLALALLAACPHGVAPGACAEQDACVSRVYVARTASVGVSATEAALVSRLGAERACALVAWSRARSSSLALALALASPAVCPACEACEAAPACESWAATAIGVGSCAICGGAAVAMCGVGR